MVLISNVEKLVPEPYNHKEKWLLFKKPSSSPGYPNDCDKDTKDLAGPIA
jgi:hypothetical protein